MVCIVLIFDELVVIIRRENYFFPVGAFFIQSPIVIVRILVEIQLGLLLLINASLILVVTLNRDWLIASLFTLT